MNIKTVFAEFGFEVDDKARRVANVSKAKANVTAAEIESGVTLERLETIGVPVFRYATQMTIHGLLPDFDGAARPGGYRHVFRNQNGSVGVRYAAVDLAKKVQIHDALRLVDRQASLLVPPEGLPTRRHGWIGSLGGSGLSVHRYFETKEECLDGLRAYPRSLAFGGVAAGAGMTGGYCVVADVAAVPQVNLWRYISAMCGLDSRADFDRVEREVAAREEERRAAAQALWQAQDAARKRAKAEAVDAYLELLASDYARLHSAPALPGSFCRVVWDDVTQRPVLRRFTVSSSGFGGGLLVSTEDRTADGSFVPVGKRRAWGAAQHTVLMSAVGAGEIYLPAVPALPVPREKSPKRRRAIAH